LEGGLFCSVIRLSGKLGERATSNPRYRHVGVSAIVTALESSYEPFFKEARTEGLKRDAGKEEMNCLSFAKIFFRRCFNMAKCGRLFKGINS
jgi:hypothetical protein